MREGLSDYVCEGEREGTSVCVCVCVLAIEPRRRVDRESIHC